jgi:hypothetical protein
MLGMTFLTEMCKVTVGALPQNFQKDFPKMSRKFQKQKIRSFHGQFLIVTLVLLVSRLKYSRRNHIF